MTAEEPSDERRNYVAVQKIIDLLLEFDAETRRHILRTVSTFFSIEIGASADRSPSTSEDADVPQFSNREDLSPKDFLFQKMPKTDVERVACLAYYLTHFRNTVHFKTTDISKLNTEAAQIKFSNASNAVNNATRSGFIVPGTRGTRQLSAPGERYVDRLPDQAAARKVMADVGPRRRRRNPKDGASASKVDPPENNA